MTIFFIESGYNFRKLSEGFEKIEEEWIGIGRHEEYYHLIDALSGRDL